MLKNYLIVAFRNLRRHRGYAFINVAGLTVGLTCCLLIFQYVAFEYSFDAFNDNAPDLYRVTQTMTRNGDTGTDALGGYAIGPALAEAVPEVVRFARIHPDYDDPVISNPEQPDNVFKETRVLYADSSFIRLFTYRLIAGDTATALAEPGTMLLSQKTARKYFGSEDPLGKVLKVTGWISGSFRINGILRDVPANSHLQFDILLPMTDLLAKSAYNDPTNGWSWQNFITYVQLRRDADVPEVERKFTDVLMAHRGEDFKRSGRTAHLNAQPLRDVHLNADITAGRIVPGSYRTVYFFAIIGLVTLLIALVNYVNLATARSMERAREVGVRKVVGAERRRLVVQFLFETALTNLVAVLLAVVLSKALLPVINHLAGTQLTGALWTEPLFWSGFAAAFVGATLLAGVYPAFVLSSFRPVSVLKGKAGPAGTRLWLRRGLVVFQFAASIVLVIGTFVVYTQLDYLRRMDLGINLEQILTVSGPQVLPDGTDVAQAAATFSHEVRQIPSVRQVATSASLPGRGFLWYSSNLRREAADPSTGVNGVLTEIDTSFARLYGLELVAGRGFEGVSATRPEGEPRPVIVNETAVRAAGFNTPSEAVDQLVAMGGARFRVVGVFKDFNWSSAHMQREAAVFALTPAGGQFSMKVSTENLLQTVADIERIYRTLFPGNPFLFGFGDEQFEAQYRSDHRFAALFTLFAALAITIACLGLLGLTATAVARRVKEIGIRKVLGANVPGLVALVSKEFVFLIVLANIVSVPPAYYVMERWLDDFAYRIDISWWIFVIAGLVALTMALATVSYQSIRAALANPVKSLRYE